MQLPRSNPEKARVNADIYPATRGWDYSSGIAVKVSGRRQQATVVLDEQEVDDLIVMLTYYKREVWGGV